jgi:hypothetical protein
MFEYSFDNAVTNVIATTKESSMSDLDLVLPPLDLPMTTHLCMRHRPVMAG